MFEVKPAHSRILPITGGISTQLQWRIKELIDQFQTNYEKIVVENYTRDCKVQIVIDGRILRVRVTNEKEDGVFRFEETSVEETPVPGTETEKSSIP